MELNPEPRGHETPRPKTSAGHSLVSLATDHGAPLRLLIPTKYGIKNLKRVGTIYFTDERPRDYWAEQGYDWFAGL